MFHRTQRPNLYDYIKIIAIALMIVDHVGYFLLPEIGWLRAVGRFAMPIFLFLVGLNGFYKWSWGLLRGALAAQAARMLYFEVAMLDVWVLSILPVIIIARAMLRCVDILYKRDKKILWWVAVGGLTVTLFASHDTLVSMMDYGSYALLRALWGHVCYRFSHTRWSLVGFFVLGVPFLMYQYEVFGRYISVGRWLWIWTGSLLSYLVLWRTVTHNDSLSLGDSLDNAVVFLSTQALRIYIYHVVILSIAGIMLFLFG